MIKTIKTTLSELDALVVLFDGYRIFYQLESNPTEAKLFLKDRIQNKESEIFISYNEKGNATGFVQLYPLFSSTRMKKLWLLNDLFVHPDFRGQGFSIALIDKAKELCKSSGSCGMMLETAKSNFIGNNLYPKTGFQLDQDHNYYNWDTE